MECLNSKQVKRRMQICTVDTINKYWSIQLNSALERDAVWNTKPPSSGLQTYTCIQASNKRAEHCAESGLRGYASVTRYSAGLSISTPGPIAFFGHFLLSGWTSYLAKFPVFIKDQVIGMNGQVRTCGLFS